MPPSDIMRRQGVRVAQVVLSDLEQIGISELHMKTLVADLMAITLGTVDAAGRGGEIDADALTVCVLRAVTGYIQPG